MEPAHRSPLWCEDSSGTSLHTIRISQRSVAGVLYFERAAHAELTRKEYQAREAISSRLRNAQQCLKVVISRSNVNTSHYLVHIKYSSMQGCSEAPLHCWSVYLSDLLVVSKPKTTTSLAARLTTSCLTSRPPGLLFVWR